MRKTQSLRAVPGRRERNASFGTDGERDPSLVRAATWAAGGAPQVQRQRKFAPWRRADDTDD
jgi:hypothetical protein